MLTAALRSSRVALATTTLLMLGGCGGGGTNGGALPRALVREARPIGVGTRFQPSFDGPVIGACRPRIGRRDGVHVEVFGANRVVIVPAGIGTRAPRRLLDGQITRARCYGELVTLAPTGVVLVRRRAHASLGDLFRAWGEPLSRQHLASFDGRVSVFVDGHRWARTPGSVPLSRHAEIVLEVGPYVPPHHYFDFPPGE